MSRFAWKIDVTGEPRRLPLLAAVAILLASVLLASGSPAAQEFDVPEGFVRIPEPEMGATGAWRHVVTIRPKEGPYSNLSAIHLRQVTGKVDDADAWLKAQLSGDVGNLKEAEILLNSPDSPFGDPAFDGLREAIPELFKGLRALAELPLQFCDGPQAGFNATGDFRELYCVYNMGPVRQYQILRLQHAAGRWFFTEIVTMNERRLRHLLAIANSFEAGD